MFFVNRCGFIKVSKKNNGASYADVTLYSYDNNGNQIRKDQSRDDLTDKPKMGLSLATVNSGYGYEKFTYNGFNQLTAFEDEAGNKATYEYYSDGLRLSKTVNGAKSSYIWTDNNLSMEIKSDEVISYAKAPGYMRTGSSKDSLYRNDKLYLFNGHGDVTSMVDKSGKVTKTYRYDAFGNEVNRDKNDTNPFRYCGEYWDNETESIYLRARYYNPSIGRFTTEDPIKDGSNWYAYCSGNPVLFKDTNGLFRIINGKAYDSYKFGSGNINNKITNYESRDIMKMQVKLQELGYLDKSITDYGYFGKQTLKAINDFKNDKGIKNDTSDTESIVGATTWALLGLDFDVMETYNNTITNVTLSRGAIHVNIEKSNFRDMAIKTLFSVAENIKKTYKIAYGKDINISTQSVYVELLGHLSPNEVSKLYYINSNFWASIKEHTDIIDIGEASVDSNRWVWDLIAGDWFD